MILPHNANPRPDGIFGKDRTGIPVDSIVFSFRIREAGVAVGAKDSAQPAAPRTLTNFGGNQTWQARYYRPRNEADVLEILNRHSQEHVRPLGAGHSWSGVVVSPDVALDMSAFDHVRPFEKNGAAFVEVGAGCRLQNLLDR